jgi:hypothetical protein
MGPAYGRLGQVALAFGGKTSLSLWTSCPKPYQNPHSEELSDLQRELQAQPGGRYLEVSPQ